MGHGRPTFTTVTRQQIDMQPAVTAGNIASRAKLCVLSLTNSIQLANKLGNYLAILWKRTFPKDKILKPEKTGNASTDG